MATRDRPKAYDTYNMTYDGANYEIYNENDHIVQE